jgi:hypothetical protein
METAARTLDSNSHGVSARPGYLDFSLLAAPETAFGSDLAVLSAFGAGLASALDASVVALPDSLLDPHL